MTVRECMDRAAEWVEENETAVEGFIGAYVGGSTAALPPESEIEGGSDMDVYVVVSGDAPDKRGKFVYKDALIEISYIREDSIFPFDRAMGDYHLANSLRYMRTLCDPTGRIADLQKAVAGDFTRRGSVVRRRDNAVSKVENGLKNIGYDKDLPDRTLSWLFPTGIATHAVLVSALRNPTVRLRYLRAREVMLEYGMRDDYEDILSLSGFSRVTPARAGKLLDNLEPIFNEAHERLRTPVFFASDIAPQSRAAAIDTPRAMIKSGLHRETLFWTLATYARAMRILLTDAPEAYARHLPAFEDALAAVGRSTDAEILSAADTVLVYIPRLIKLTDKIIDRCAD